MIRFLGKVPKEVVIACSGGLDSMVATDFLLRSNRSIKLAYFNHDTVHSREAQKFVEDFANSRNLDLVIGRMKGTKGKRSLEEYWRDERYDFINSISSKFIVTCHHLDDAVETWLMSSLHGQPKLIPYRRFPNVYRPFLITGRKVLETTAKRNLVKWIEDPSNLGSNPRGPTKLIFAPP